MLLIQFTNVYFELLFKCPFFSTISSIWRGTEFQEKGLQISQ